MTWERTATGGGEVPPSWEEVAQVLRARIRDGVLRAGDPLPALAELAAEFRVERAAIRAALRSLREEGLLAEGTRGVPARVVPDADGPPPARVSLGTRVLEAFDAPDVRIDAVCLTTESLTLALAEPTRRIFSGGSAPRSVRVRVLLPSGDLHLVPPEREGAGPAHERWRAVRAAQSAVLRHSLTAVGRARGLDVEVSFGDLPFTPPVKLYLLNGSEALFGHHCVERRTEEAGGSTAGTSGGLGDRPVLLAFARSSGRAHDLAFVEQSQRWFDGLWAQAATDLPD